MLRLSEAGAPLESAGVRSQQVATGYDCISH